MQAVMADKAGRTALFSAIAIPALLWGGAALVAQRWFGLFPCEMCMWQRWPHMAALALGLIALLLRNQPVSRLLVALAALAIAVSGAIGLFHAGVEYQWWQGFTQCIMSAPLVRCDVAPWTLAGISLAGFNAIFSVAGAVWIAVLLMKNKAPAYAA